MPSLAFDGCLNVNEVVRANVLSGWSFHDLEVTKSRKFNRQVLKRLGRLIDEKDIEHNIELVNLS